jgi:hypothetical protein
MSTHTAARTLIPLLSVCALLAAPVTGAQASAATPPQPPPLEHFIQRDSFLDIKISPDGKHLAANMPVKGGSALFMLDSTTLQRKGHFYAGEDLEVADFWWSSDTRLLISPAQRFLGDEAPSFTGEIYAVNVDGSQPIALVGYRADDGRQHTRIKNRENESVWALPIDLLPGVDRQVLVQVDGSSYPRSNLPGTPRRLPHRRGGQPALRRRPERRQRTGAPPSAPRQRGLGAARFTREDRAASLGVGLQQRRLGRVPPGLAPRRTGCHRALRAGER